MLRPGWPSSYRGTWLAHLTGEPLFGRDGELGVVEFIAEDAQTCRVTVRPCRHSLQTTLGLLRACGGLQRVSMDRRSGIELTVKDPAQLRWREFATAPSPAGPVEPLDARVLAGVGADHPSIVELSGRGDSWLTQTLGVSTVKILVEPDQLYAARDLTNGSTDAAFEANGSAFHESAELEYVVRSSQCVSLQVIEATPRAGVDPAWLRSLANYLRTDDAFQSSNMIQGIRYPQQLCTSPGIGHPARPSSPIRIAVNTEHPNAGAAVSAINEWGLSQTLSVEVKCVPWSVLVRRADGCDGRLVVLPATKQELTLVADDHRLVLAVLPDVLLAVRRGERPLGVGTELRPLTSWQDEVGPYLTTEARSRVQEQEGT